MARFHFNYLNADYNQDVTTSWTSNGCMDEVKRRLGYRFELINGSISSGTLTLSLRNVGFGNLINDRKAYIVARNTTTGVETALQINTNTRLWNAGSTVTITQSLSTLPAGTYALFLNLPDTKLGSNPIYSVRFANEGTWDATKGYNTLNLTYSTTTGGAGTPPVVTVPTTPTTPTTATVSIFLDSNDIIQAANLPCTTGNFTVKVYNSAGRLKSTQMDISSLKKGIYLIKIVCNGTTYTQSVSKTTGSW